MVVLPQLDHSSLWFPAAEEALAEPNGLLAWGGDLRPPRLLAAYRHGIFPWFEEGQPILWWSPDPRAVLTPRQLHISRSLRRTLRRGRFQITFDRAFTAVMRGCAGRAETWIGPAMVDAYMTLHELGHAHSVECWRDGELVGGLYGVALGRAFFGESMFSRATDASKVALVHLCGQLEEWGFAMIDCQVSNPHTLSLGARELPRQQFLQRLRDLTAQELSVNGQRWTLQWAWRDQAGGLA
ncbi:MAG: leucyl/phenylalanyl-tRNA--protein transferase [Spongiibacteraceae bacterium]|jgi:leucyl/phenylalanyl-tRNA--protein transferase|nr:leucyl/phenylalanyl-tRNA--protein transferase [Spongiibacteraceae bacterium]